MNSYRSNQTKNKARKVSVRHINFTEKYGSSTLFQPTYTLIAVPRDASLWHIVFTHYEMVASLGTRHSRYQTRTKNNELSLMTANMNKSARLSFRQKSGSELDGATERSAMRQSLSIALTINCVYLWSRCIFCRWLWVLRHTMLIVDAITLKCLIQGGES